MTQSTVHSPTSHLQPSCKAAAKLQLAPGRTQYVKRLSAGYVNTSASEDAPSTMLHMFSCSSTPSPRPSCPASRPVQHVKASVAAYSSSAGQSRSWV